MIFFKILKIQNLEVKILAWLSKLKLKSKIIIYKFYKISFRFQNESDYLYILFDNFDYMYKKKPPKGIGSTWQN